MQLTSLARAAALGVVVFGASVPRAWAGSPFEGYWRGNWQDPGAGQGGTIYLDIDDTGDIEGTVSNNGAQASSPLAGQIEDAGHVHITYSYDGGRTTYAGDGTFTRSGDQIGGRVAFLAPNGQQIGLGDVALRRAPPEEAAAHPAPGVDVRLAQR